MPTNQMHACNKKVGHYHAEMPAQDRERTHRLWSQGRVPCIAATVAFGMGINKVCWLVLWGWCAGLVAMHVRRAV